MRVEFNQHDRYGRIVGKVWVTPPDCPTCGKTLDVGLAQVMTGMAWWYRRYDKTEELENAERYAKENKIGLWADKNPIAPWDWRKGKR